MSGSEAKKKPFIFSEETLLPAGFVLILLGGAGWLTSLHKDVQAAQIKIDRMEKSIEDTKTAINNVQNTMGAMSETLKAIDKRLERIEK